MSFIGNQRVAQAAHLKKVLQAKSVHEASKIGKCLQFCESLGINEFSFEALAHVIDMRPSLGADECMLTRVTEPESFVIVRREGSYMSPLIEIEEELLWAFDDSADQYTENPVIMDSSKVHIFSTRRGD